MTTENLLDELLFWMVRLIFPQPLVTLSLSLLPVPCYRVRFRINAILRLLLLQTRFAPSFFRLYPRIANVLLETAVSDQQEVLSALGSRIIHISVQVLHAHSPLTVFITDWRAS
jgi:hypothetical protein